MIVSSLSGCALLNIASSHTNNSMFTNILHGFTYMAELTSLLVHTLVLSRLYFLSIENAKQVSM
jgi:hypothetical protein